MRGSERDESDGVDTQAEVSNGAGHRVPTGDERSALVVREIPKTVSEKTNRQHPGPRQRTEPSLHTGRVSTREPHRSEMRWRVNERQACERCAMPMSKRFRLTPW